MATDSQMYRIEIRFDFNGTHSEAWAEAERVRALFGDSADVTAVFDEEFEEVEAGEHPHDYGDYSDVQ